MRKRIRRLLNFVLINVNKLKPQPNRQYHYIPKHSEKLLSLKRMWQRSPGVVRPNSACGPTVAASIVDYFSDIGVVTRNHKDEATLINLLYKRIGTTLLGTSAKRWQKAMEQYVNEYSKAGK